jgi:hypothetical protein
MRNMVTFLAIFSFGAGIAGAATSEDVQFRILPAQVVIPPSPDGIIPVDVTVTVSTTVDGMQGWCFGVRAENVGLTKFTIATAVAHPDLASLNGGGNVEFDSIQFYEAAPGGGYAGVTQGVIVDMNDENKVPATPGGLGSLVITAHCQGADPSQGFMNFAENLGQIPYELCGVFDGFCIKPNVHDGAMVAMGSGPFFVPGDVNGDARVSIADAYCLQNYLFAAGQISCEAAADTNGDGRLNIADSVLILGHLTDGRSFYPSPLGCEQGYSGPPLSDPTITMKLDDLTVTVQSEPQEITVPLRLRGMTGGLYAWQATVTYPTDKFEFVRATVPATGPEGAPGFFKADSTVAGKVRLFLVNDMYAMVPIPVTDGTKIADVVLRSVGPQAGSVLVDIVREYGDAELVSTCRAVLPRLAGGYITYISPARFIRGDFDGNGRFDLRDVVSEVAYLISGAQPAPTCMDAADMNDDGQINAVDPLVGLRVILTILPRRLPPPYPWCGLDPTQDALGCASYTACP